MNFTEEDLKNFWDRCKAASSEELENLALEYYRMAPNLEKDNDRRLHTRVLSGYANYSSRYWDVFMDAFSKLNVDEKLDYCISFCKSGSNFEEFGLGYKERWQNLPATLSNATVRRIDELRKLDRSNRDFPDAVYPKLKNQKNLPYDLRNAVSNYLIGRQPKELQTLKPEFHTLQTIQSLARQNVAPKSLAEVLRYHLQGSRYYSIAGSGTGAVPATWTERFDTASKNIFDGISKEYAEDLKQATRRQMIAYDLMDGKAALLGPNDPEIALRELSHFKNVKEITDKLDSDTTRKLASAANNYRPGYGESKTFDKLKTLLYEKEVFTALDQAKNEDEKLKIALGHKWILEDAASSDYKETRTQTDSVLKSLETIADEREKRVNNMENDAEYLKLKEFFRNYNREGSDIFALENAIIAGTNLNKCAKGLQGVLPEYDGKEVNRLFRETLDGESVQLKAPVLNMPLLFGKKKVQEKQARIDDAVDRFNKSLKDMRNKVVREGYGESVKEILGKMDGDILNDAALQKLEAEYKNRNHAHQQEGYQFRINDNLLASKKQEIQSMKRENDNLHMLLETVRKSQQRKKADLETARQKLHKHQEETQMTPVGKKGATEVVRETNVPKTAPEKTKVAQERYQARKQAVGRN
jgi:hypothetical protein